MSYARQMLGTHRADVSEPFTAEPFAYIRLCRDYVVTTWVLGSPRPYAASHATRTHGG
jgi:hypothetical protein